MPSEKYQTAACLAAASAFAAAENRVLFVASNVVDMGDPDQHDRGGDLDRGRGHAHRHQRRRRDQRGVDADIGCYSGNNQSVDAARPKRQV